MTAQHVSNTTSHRFRETPDGLASDLVGKLHFVTGHGQGWPQRSYPGKVSTGLSAPP
jgi:hypothetical protein